jgi:hypothetical protein
VSVAKADTTTTLSASVNPSPFGQSVTFAAIVTSATPGAGIPVGTMTFLDGATVLAGPVPVDGNGLATFSTSTLNAGTHVITVEYSGGDSFNPSAGDVVVAVTPKAATITANNRVKEYGDVAIFAGTEFVAAGFIGTDTVNGVTLTSAGASATAVLGAHPIVPGAAFGSGLGNYAIDYRNGTLLVQDTTAPVLTVPGPITRDAVGASGTPVTFTTSAADRHDGAVTTACTPASGSTFPIGATTVTCIATDSSGNKATASFAVTISDDPTPGKMHGGGHVMSGVYRYDFNISVLEIFNGKALGRFKLKICQPMPRRRGHDDDDDFTSYRSHGENDDDEDDGNDHDFEKHERDDEGRCAGTAGRFFATTFTFVRFSDDPAFVPGGGRISRRMMDTAVFAGVGAWNGVRGYRYEVKATDQGEPGRTRDTFEVTITAPDGTVVAHANARLTAGNLQSIFVPDFRFIVER